MRESSPGPDLTQELVEQSVAAVDEGVADRADRATARTVEQTLQQVLEETTPFTPAGSSNDAGTGLSPEGSRVDDSSVPAAVVLPDQVTGSYASSLISTQLELESLGWTRSGSVDLTKVEVFALDDVLVAVRACVDSSGVVLRDGQGKRIPNPTPSSQHVFLLQPTQSGYTVVAQTFAQNTSC